MSAARPIHAPRDGQPMRVVCFVSGGGGNLRAALELSRRHPELVEVGLVVSDRPGIPAIAIAEEHGVPLLVYDFQRECGSSRDAASPDELRAYRDRARAFHDGVAASIEREEERTRPFDLAVLSYRRWIHGILLEKFRDRMINQHPGDLSILCSAGRRTLVGLHAVEDAIRLGHHFTRTSTFLVDAGDDTGEILCQGPRVELVAPEPGRAFAQDHEALQKEKSDWPSLRFALREIARGAFAISAARHPTGERVIEYHGRPLPYGGVDLDLEETPC